MIEQARERVVVIGAGFGGRYAARALRKAPADVTVLNGTNHHVFEPLIYQVATGVLSPGEVATPVRELFRGQRNAEVLLGWVTDVDPSARTVTATAPGGKPYQVPYDTLIVAAGTAQSYFGNDRFAEHAPSLKSIDDAVELRSKILTAFEMAELDGDPRWLTFVIVGAGPTGVELAGQIAEIAHRTLPGEYRRIDPSQARIVLVDAVDRILPTFTPASSEAAAKRLRKIGVEIRLGARVVDVDATGVQLSGGERIDSMTKVWSAGVAAAPFAARLAEATGAPTDRSGRILVDPDLTIPGHPEIFVVGDLASLDGLPGVAQVSIQGGRHAGRTIARRLAGDHSRRPFKYFDKGNIATVSRFSAVADLRGLRLSGLPGWLLWLAVHWAYLPKGRNRAASLVRWAVTFLGRSRPERAVTARQANPVPSAPPAPTATAAPLSTPTAGTLSPLAPGTLTPLTASALTPPAPGTLTRPAPSAHTPAAPGTLTPPAPSAHTPTAPSTLSVTVASAEPSPDSAREAGHSVAIPQPR